MLRLFCLLGVCYPLWGSAQTHAPALPIELGAPKYLLLADYKQAVHHVVTHRTGTEYLNVSAATVELFNFLLPRPVFSDSLLITCAVLPAADGQLRWRQVRLDSIPQTQLVSRAQLVREAQQRLAAFEQAGRPPTRTLLSSLDFLPLVERQGKHYLPRATVLTSFLLIKPGAVHTVAQASLALIDVKSPVFATDDLLKAAIWLQAICYKDEITAGMSFGRMCSRNLIQVCCIKALGAFSINPALASCRASMKPTFPSTANSSTTS
jgi:hypothetical protein